MSYYTMERKKNDISMFHPTILFEEKKEKHPVYQVENERTNIKIKCKWRFCFSFILLFVSYADDVKTNYN